MGTENAKHKRTCLLIGCLGLFLVALVVVAASVGVFFFWDVIEDHCHRRDFDAQQWRAQKTIEHDTMWPPRLCMVDDLMTSGRLDGLTKDEVVAMLGPPAEKGFPGGATDCDIHYFLGPERGFFRIDSEWLFITFGEHGKVKRYWLYRD